MISRGQNETILQAYAKAHRSLRTPVYPRLRAYTCMGGSHVDALMLSIPSSKTVYLRLLASNLITARICVTPRIGFPIHQGTRRAPHVSCTTSHTSLVYVSQARVASCLYLDGPHTRLAALTQPWPNLN